MKVQMKARISGLRDGVEWPAPGESIDVPEAEALELLASGLAVPLEAPVKAGPETATAPAAEKAAPTKPRGRRQAATEEA